MTPLETALAHVSKRNWPVFPCQWAGEHLKEPLLRKGLLEATRDREQIVSWWRRWPRALIGIPTGKPSGIVVVLDIDVKPPKKPGSWQTGFDTLADLDKLILPEVPMVHTTSDGLHLHFACHPELEIRNSIGQKGLGPGLDVRGDGGYVIVPSPGGGYRWDPHWNYSTCAPIPAPAWLGRRPPKVRTASSGDRRRFDPQAFLNEACRRIWAAPDGVKRATIREETFRVATLVRDQLLEEREARHALQAEIVPVGIRADGHTDKVDRDFESSFVEGLRAPARRGRR
jgi:putative DNA primase/helicase